MSQTLLLEAVQQHALTSKQGLLERLFALWFNGFVYNQIWEDPRIDLKALCLDGDSRVLCIASGGCNVLNYLVDQPESITAVDLNANHVFLTKLKIAALRYLPSYEDFFNFFGHANQEGNAENYYKHIRSHLDHATREFWEGGFVLSKLWRGPRINYFTRNLYNYSRNGYFLRLFHALARAIGCDTSRLLEAESREEQERIYEEAIEPFFETRAIKLLSKFQWVLFGLGIPPQQYEELKRGETANDLLDVYRERVKRLACSFPVEDNYFAWQAFARSYDMKTRRAIPDYLKEENYTLLKQNAHRTDAINASFTDFLESQPRESFNRFVLLDAQDWMTKAQLRELWSQIARVGPVGSRIIFRTAASASPLEKALSPSLLMQFEYERELSQKLFKQDRAGLYGGFHVYSLVR